MSIRYQVAPGTMLRRRGDELVVSACGHVQLLDPVGVAMLRTIVVRGDVDDAIDALVNEFDADRSEIAADLQEFLDGLETDGVLSRVGDGGSRQGAAQSRRER